MSLTNIDKSIINSNPINHLIGVRTRIWTCKHIGVTVIDEQNWIYKCLICWPSGGEIRVIPNAPKEQTLTNGLRVYNTAINNSASWYNGVNENVLTTELVLDLSGCSVKSAAK
jgi:hypothetical protein